MAQDLVARVHACDNHEEAVATAILGVLELLETKLKHNPSDVPAEIERLRAETPMIARAVVADPSDPIRFHGGAANPQPSQPEPERGPTTMFGNPMTQAEIDTARARDQAAEAERLKEADAERAERAREEQADRERAEREKARAEAQRKVRADDEAQRKARTDARG